MIILAYPPNYRKASFRDRRINQLSSLGLLFCPRQHACKRSNSGVKPPWEMFAMQQASNTNHHPEPTCCSCITVITYSLLRRCIESFSRLGSDLSVKNDSDADDEILCIKIGSFGLLRGRPNCSIVVDHRQYELAMYF